MIAAQTGWPIDKVERYAGPPLAERAHIVALAQAVELRRSGGTRNLAEVAAAVLSADGAALADLDWDSRRRDDGRWTVTAVGADRGIDAEWTYDQAGRSLQPVSADARLLMGILPPAEPAPEPVAAEPDVVDEEDEQPVPGRPRLVAVASEPEPADEEPQDSGDDVVDARHQTIALPVEDAPRPAPAAKPRPKPKSKGRRASVPSWDEILFGTQHHDAD